MPGTPRNGVPVGTNVEEEPQAPTIKTDIPFDERVEAVFKIMDTDNSQSLTVKEITDFISSAGLSEPVATTLSEDLFTRWDADQEQNVDIDEFRSYFKDSNGDSNAEDKKKMQEERLNLLVWFEKLAKSYITDPHSPRRRTVSVLNVKREHYPQRMADLGVSITSLVEQLDEKVDAMLEVITDFHAKQRTVAQAKGRRKSQRRMSSVSPGGAVMPREQFCAESMDLALDDYNSPKDESPVGTLVPGATMSHELLAHLKNTFQSNFLFHEVEEEAIDKIIKLMECFEIEVGTDIEAGTLVDSMFVVESGLLQVQGSDDIVQRLEAFSEFGEVALVRTEKLAYTLSALDGVRVWGLRRADFRSFLAEDAHDQHGKILRFIKKVELLKPLGDDTHVAIARAMTHRTFEEGDVIMKEGDKPDNFYVMQHGQVVVTKHIGDEPNYFLCNLGKGDFFGELAFMNDAPRAATIKATKTTECYVLGKDEFTSIIGPLKEVLEERHILRILKNSMDAFKNGDETVLKEIIKRFQKVRIPKGEYIVKEGEAGDAFYVIETGVCSIIKFNNTAQKNMMLAKLQPGKYFGERGLMPGEEGKRAASIVAHDDDVKVLRLGQEDFVELVAPFFVEQARITGVKFEDATVVQEEREIDEDALRLERELKAMPCNNLREVASISTCNIQDLTCIAHGVFGNIRFIKGHDGTDRTMKCMQKSRILASKRKQSPLREKQALCRVTNFNYITHLYSTAFDHDQLYLITDCHQGGDVHAAIYAVYSEFPKHPEFDGLATNLIVDWTAQVVSALEHLHSRGVVHRDLKPENIKISSDGSLKLIDFSLSKLLPYVGRDGVLTDETYTLCGTMEYLAPEVILSHGHSFAVDFWCLGILIYELFCRVTPFESDDESQLETLTRVVASHQYLGFPHGFDPNAKTLIRHLLTPIPGARMGNWKGGFNDIKSHVFFYLLAQEIDWAAVENNTMDHIYAPDNLTPGSAMEPLPIIPYSSLGLDEYSEFFGSF